MSLVSPQHSSDATRRFGETVSFSTFLRRTDTRPRRYTMPWSEFAKRLTKHEERLRKDGPMFSPATFKAGSTRANENVVWISMLVADLDDDFDWSAIQGRIEPYAYAAYSTYSSTPQHLKLRVVMPLLAPVSASAWPDCWYRANDHLFLGHMDPSTKPPSQAYYLPSCPPGAVRVPLNHE
jgi:hypothetical protein